MNKILKFYKYQLLSEEKHFIYLQNYLNQKVWLVPLEQFNDPFEGKCSSAPLSPEFILSNLHIFDSLLKQHHLNGMPELTADEFKKLLNSEELRNYLKNNPRISEFKKHGALCLTRKNNNIPMWAYYADNHKGYCVEFELDFTILCEVAKFDQDKIDELINIITHGSGILSRKLGEDPQAFVFGKVRYNETMPSIVFEDFIKLTSLYDQLKYIFENSVGVKSIEWKHEDEFRLIMNGNSEECGLLPLAGRLAPFLKVTGIIIGDQMEENRRKRVLDLCQNKKIRLYSATCSDSLYEIIIKPYLNMSHDASLHVKEKDKYQPATEHLI
jgi:hypothetical protein